jgi:tetratricopeptide (TPR) repeat protein
VLRTKALGTLTGYAFITERQQAVPGSSKERLFDMHRLVHMALIWWLEGHGERASWAGIAAARAAELVPYGGHEGKEVWTAYLPHAMYVARLVNVVDGAMSASLLERLGRCQKSLGQYASAETSDRKATTLKEEVLGPEHPDTLTSMSNLAWMLSSQGKYEEAEAMNRQTLARYERVLGPEHPDTLGSVYCLAHLLAKQQRVDESLLWYQRASDGYDTALGKDHPTTVACHQHYADLCASQELHQLACSSSTLDSSEGTSTRKRLRQSQELANIDIGSWKHRR